MESHKKEMNEDSLIDLIKGLEDKKGENPQVNIRDAVSLLLDKNFQVGLSDPQVIKILETKLYLVNKGESIKKHLDVKKLKDAGIFENIPNCYENADLRKFISNFYETDILLKEKENKEKQINESKDSNEISNLKAEIARLMEKINAYSAEKPILVEKLKEVVTYREIVSAYNQKSSFLKDPALSEAQYKAKIDNAVLNLLQCKVIERHIIKNAPPIMQVSKIIWDTIDRLPRYISQQNKAENEKNGNKELKEVFQGGDQLVPLRKRLINQVREDKITMGEAKLMLDNLEALYKIEDTGTQSQLVSFKVVAQSIQEDLSKRAPPRADEFNMRGNIKKFIAEEVGLPHKISIPIPEAAPGSTLDISTINAITKNYLENKTDFFTRNYPGIDPVKLGMLKVTMDKICELNKKGGQSDKVVALYAVYESFRRMDLNNYDSITNCKKTINDNMETLEKFDSRLGKAGAAIKQTFFSTTKDTVTMSNTRLLVRELSDFIENKAMPQARISSFRVK